MAAIVIDESELPIITVRWPHTVSDAEIAAMFERFDAIYARAQPFVTLLDVRYAPLPSPNTLNLIARLAGSQVSNASKYARATGVVIPSRLLRGSLNTLFWIYTPPTPVHVFDTEADALAWIVTFLPKARSPSPSR